MGIPRTMQRQGERFWLDETNPDELERRARDFEASAHFGLAEQLRDRAAAMTAIAKAQEPSP